MPYTLSGELPWLCNKKNPGDFSIEVLISGTETEHQGRSGSNFSQHAAKSEAELPETLGRMC